MRRCRDGALAVALLAGLQAVGAAVEAVEPTSEHRHVEEIASGHHEYDIVMGGTVDMDNSLTRSHGNIEVAFQPNISVTIENTGDVPVVNPRLVVNGRGNWYTLAGMVEEWTRGATTDQEKAYLIWENARHNRYHQSPLFRSVETFDPVKMFNVYGLNLCGQVGNAVTSLFLAAGLEGSYTRALHGHVQCEACVDGRHQFLDADQDCFYLDRENEAPISGDECARDADLVRRELNYGPLVEKWSYHGTAALFGPDDTEDSRPRPTGHEIAFTLRPGVRLVYRWDNVGKWAADREGVEPKYWGNSQFVYEPRLDLASVRRDASRVRGLADAEHGAGLQVQGSNGALVYEISPSYVICGGRVRAEFVARGDGDRLSISLSTDGHSFQRVWEHEGSGPVTADVSLDEALQPHQNPPKYRYLVGVRMGSKTGLSDAMLTSLRIETDVMAAPLSLPRLSLGANHIVYTDDTPGPHSVRVTHRWQECDAIQPPAPPSGPVHLPPGARVTDSILEYSWPEVAGADRYHLQVSRRPDFAWPYRTSLDVMIPDTAWRMPHTGIYSPGTTYYWRLRARDHSGVWGPWSDTWTFTWRGPRVPVNVRLHFDGRTGTLRWEPNPRGERPVRYATFGSNERGFTAHREPYTQFKRGEVPANLIGETTESSMVVITDQRPAENMNCVFYRVVAIDERGTESGSSEYAEAPHPFIYTSPVTRATAGRLYGYEAGSLGSLGDCQNRPKPEEGGYNYGYHDIEENRFELLESPRWLSVDAETGLVSGTPPPEAAGEHQVRLGVTNQFGGRDEQRFTLRVAK